MDPHGKKTVTPRRLAEAAALILALAPVASRAAAQDTAAVRLARDSLSVEFVEAELRSVVQALARFLPKPVLIGGLPSVRVTLETPHPIAQAELLPLLRGLLEGQNLELEEEQAFYRVRAKSMGSTPGARASPGGLAAEQRAAPVQLFVVRLRHARAADVAATVNLLFGARGEFSSALGLSTGTLSDELRRSAVAPVEGPGAAAPVGLPSTGQPGSGASRSATLTSAVTIVPDEMTNSLLIRASADDFHVLEEAVAELDIRPLQVLIEVLIVEARSDRNFSLGADLFVPEQPINSTATASAMLTGGGLGDLVIRVMNLGSADVNATIRAAQSRGQVDIVSRPVLLASNNTEARLLVGSQRPFVQVSRSLPTDTPSRDQVVQYRDVGTKLTVRPTINYDGYVSLQIQQEVNAATNETQFDAPVISTREAATRVLVRDGQTIVIGGLKDLQRDATQSGVPLLSGIPIVGGLFGSASRQRTATELYLFLTPHILKTDADADSVTAPRLPRERDP